MKYFSAITGEYMAHNAIGLDIRAVYPSQAEQPAEKML